MPSKVSVDKIQVERGIYDFVNGEAIPGTGVDPRAFWNGFASLVSRLAPRNAAFLHRRDEFQTMIDAWHRQNSGADFHRNKYKTFLGDIGYLVPEKDPFSVNTANVDAEIAHMAGPQLVVPMSNARYALNAANARWGSLYDALYGSDAIPKDGGPRDGKYDPERGAKVIAFVRDFLDEHFEILDTRCALS